MFTNAKHIRISGNPQFNIYNDNRVNLVDDGMRLLLARVVKGAMHNSGDRFDGPKCHPETRIALQDDILGWADEFVEDLNEIVTWLYGPAGAGKSAIAQTIAEKLHDRDQLTASFFFSRASGGEGRGAETDVIATLAYQLSQSVPATQPHIATTVQKNPLIFDLALQDQVNALIVAPLVAISETSPGLKKPRIIVVDGLDECRKEKDAQRRVVNALISGLRQVPHYSHKLFVTSRPEHNIVSIFNAQEQKVVRRMELDNKWKPDDDIRTFLLAGFADIRRTHFYFQNYPAEKTWPSLQDIQTLVDKSSRQFIYASVVLKYIKSEENYNPVTRLETILNLDNNEDRPYAELDALYHYIFSQVEDVEGVLHILSLEQFYELDHLGNGLSPPHGLCYFLSDFLGLDEGVIGFQLRPLNSILSWSPEDGISYKHASLPDFLFDKTRSGDFHINSPNTAVTIVSRAVKLLETGKTFKIFPSGFLLLIIQSYYAQILPHDQKFHVWSLLSNFNVLETLLCNWQEMYVNNFKIVFSVVADYINWIVKESEKEASLYLSQPVAQIQTWIVNHLELMNANYFESSQIDPWPFFVAEPSTLPERTLEQDLGAALEILGHPNSSGFKVEESHHPQMMLLWYFMGTLDWLDRSDLLGYHAMTAERYGAVLHHVAYYLLRWPEDMLSGMFWDYSSELLIGALLDELFLRSPETTDTYFLVALLYPVIDNLVVPSSHLPSAYTQRVVKKFPFLTDPTSLLYIRASTKLRNTLVNLKVKSHLHKVAEREQWTSTFQSQVPYKHFLEIFTEIDSRVYELCDRVEEL